jgi:hypothetical protein
MQTWLAPVASMLILLVPSCSIPADRTAYYIAAPIGSRVTSCDTVARAVRAYALASGYSLLEPPPKVPGRIATYVQPTYESHCRSIFVSCSGQTAEVEAASEGDTDSLSARAERRHIFEYLQSRGLTASLQQRRYRGMIEIIPFAP